MKNTQKYFSLVSDRLAELKTELRRVQMGKANCRNSELVKRYQLEEEFLKRKIDYLENLVELPLFMLISNLPQDQLEEIGFVGRNASQLIKVLKLEKLKEFLKQPKVVTFSKMKDAFMEDFNSLEKLLSMNQENMELEKQKDTLYGEGLTGEVSYQQILCDEKKVNLESAKLDKEIRRDQEDFNADTLKEISWLLFLSKTKLPKYFIARHREKVLETNPEMEKVVKRLSKRNCFSWFKNLLPLKRSKDEQLFMDTLMDYYNNRPILAELGMKPNTIFEESDAQLEDLSKLIKHTNAEKKYNISVKKHNIKKTKTEIIKQIEELEEKQKVKKQEFVSFVYSKTNYFPENFQDQLWNETDLKESCLFEACFFEEKKLMDEIMNQLRGYEPTYLRVVKPKEKVKSNRLVA